MAASLLQPCGVRAITGRRRRPRQASGVTSYAAQLREMAAMQARYNRELHPQWQEQGFAFHRAVWIECAELLDHYGWKWWQHQVPALAQVRLELVDIWHFGLSDLLRAGAVDDALAARMLALSDPSGGQDFRAAVEAMALTSLRDQRFDVDAFVLAMNALPMSLDELHLAYIGKNVLNSFRQAHGYRDGSYVKAWDGREDNEHLVELAAQLNPASGTFTADLRAALEARYAQLAAS